MKHKVVERNKGGKIVSIDNKLFYAPKMNALLKHISGGRQIYHPVITHGDIIFGEIKTPCVIFTDGDWYQYSFDRVYF